MQDLICIRETSHLIFLVAACNVFRIYGTTVNERVKFQLSMHWPEGYLSLCFQCSDDCAEVPVDTTKHTLWSGSTQWTWIIWWFTTIQKCQEAAHLQVRVSLLFCALLTASETQCDLICLECLHVKFNCKKKCGYKRQWHLNGAMSASVLCIVFVLQTKCELSF